MKIWIEMIMVFHTLLEIPNWLNVFEPHPWRVPLDERNKEKSHPHATAITLQAARAWISEKRLEDFFSDEHNCPVLSSPAPQTLPLLITIEWLPPPVIWQFLDIVCSSSFGIRVAVGTETSSDSNPCPNCPWLLVP